MLKGFLFLYMESLVVGSHFLHDKSIQISINKLFKNSEAVEGFLRIELKNNLILAAKESYLIFNREISINKSSIW